MYEVQRTARFSEWLVAVEDGKAYAAVLARLVRLGMGNSGDSKAVGAGVSELRIDIGPGYCVYYTRVGARILMVLGGGDKHTRAADIEKAIQMAKELKAPVPVKAARRAK